MKYQITNDFVSADPETRGKRFEEGKIIDSSMFSKDYLDSLNKNKYIKELEEYAPVEEYKESPIVVEIPKVAEPVKAPEVIEAPKPTLVNTPKPIETTMENNISLESKEDQIVKTIEDRIVHDLENKTINDFETKIIGPTVITIVAIILACVSGYMTVSGYSSLFPNGKEMMIVALTSLELAKFSIASVVMHNKLIDKVHKTLLIGFVVCLVFMSAIGHYGFLSGLYSKSSLSADTTKEKAELISTQITSLTSEKAMLQKQYDQMDPKYVKAKIKMYNLTSEKVKEIDTKLSTLIKEKEDMIKQSSSTEHQENSIVMNSSKLLKVTPDNFMLLVIALFSLIIDPLVVLLASTASKLRNGARTL